MRKILTAVFPVHVLYTSMYQAKYNTHVNPHTEVYTYTYAYKIWQLEDTVLWARYRLGIQKKKKIEQVNMHNNAKSS